MISLPSGMEFTFLDPAPPLLPDSASLSSSSISASASAVTRPRKRDPSTLEPTPQDAPFSSSDPNLTNPSSNDYSRIHKIRIVEKLLTTHNSLPSPNHHPLLFNPNDPSPSFSISEDDWLDDKSLSLLSSSDLEKLMDRYLYNVVNQLVQLAISDDDLKAELDHLDSRSLLPSFPCLDLSHPNRSSLTTAATRYSTTAVSSTSPPWSRSCSPKYLPTPQLHFTLLILSTGGEHRFDDWQWIYSTPSRCR
jgi:hypothetical protein